MSWRVNDGLWTLRHIVDDLEAEIKRLGAFEGSDGCSTGDCPHDNINECVQAQAKIIAVVIAENEQLRDALQTIATYDQDERPLPDGEGAFAWDAPFDWRRRSMKQERIARDAIDAAMKEGGAAA